MAAESQNNAVNRSGEVGRFAIEYLSSPLGYGCRYPTENAMLSLVLCLIASIPPTSSGRSAAEAAADQSGLSHLLSLTLEYDDSPHANFTATLKNRSGTDLEVMARFAELHGTFHVMATDGTETKLYMPSYRTLLLTSTWFDPTEHMPAGAHHRWNVRLNQLVDLHGKPMPKRRLLGCKVSLTISRVAVIPRGLKTSFVSSNAMQRSTPIRIPDGR